MTDKEIEYIVWLLKKYYRIANSPDDLNNIIIEGHTISIIQNGVEIVSSKIEEENIKKSNALFNNYKDGFISKVDDTMVIKQIITLNPYRTDIYEYLVKEEGDFNRETERLAEYLGYDLKPFKSKLMDEYINDCLENDTDIDFIKEKVVKYAKYIGSLNEEIYLTRIDAIRMFENA